MNSSIFSSVHITMIIVLVVVGIVFSYVAYTTYTTSHPQFINPNQISTQAGWPFMSKALRAYGWASCPPVLKHPEALCKGDEMMNSTLPGPLGIGPQQKPSIKVTNQNITVCDANKSACYIIALPANNSQSQPYPPYPSQPPSPPLPELNSSSSSYPMYNQSNQYMCPNETAVLCIGPHLANQSIYFVPTN